MEAEMTFNQAAHEAERLLTRISHMDSLFPHHSDQLRFIIQAVNPSYCPLVESARWVKPRRAL